MLNSTHALFVMIATYERQLVIVDREDGGYAPGHSPKEAPWRAETTSPYRCLAPNEAIARAEMGRYYAVGHIRDFMIVDVQHVHLDSILLSL